MSGRSSRLGLPPRTPLPPTLAVGDHALRLRVEDPAGEWSVVLRCRAGELVVEDGCGVAPDAVPALPTPIPIEDLAAWCRDPDRLLGPLIPTLDLGLDTLVLASCFDGVVGVVKESTTAVGQRGGRAP